MRIGELARRTGVSVRALRYYEEQGLLVPERAANGYRDYPTSAVDYVRSIQLLYAAGLTSTKVTKVLPAACGQPGSVMTSADIEAELRKVHARLTREIEQRQASLHLLGHLLASSVEKVIDDACGVCASAAG